MDIALFSDWKKHGMMNQYHSPMAWAWPAFSKSGIVFSQAKRYLPGSQGSLLAVMRWGCLKSRTVHCTRPSIRSMIHVVCTLPSYFNWTGWSWQDSSRDDRRMKTCRYGGRLPWPDSLGSLYVHVGSRGHNNDTLEGVLQWSNTFLLCIGEFTR